VTPLLAINDIDHHYGSAQTLRAVSLAIAEGECLALLGRNGAGKTTLLRCLMGLLPLSRGHITLRGESISGWSSSRRVRGGIGYVPQGREIFADLSVAENLLIGQKVRGARDDALLDEVCALFPILRNIWNRRGGDLSGGQQQQLAIGRALMTRPHLLVLDEPTEGIQPSIVKSIEGAIVSLKGRMSILLVEQYFDFARSLADRFVVLNRGAVALSGTGAEMDRDTLGRYLSI